MKLLPLPLELVRFILCNSHQAWKCSWKLCSNVLQVFLWTELRNFTPGTNKRRIMYYYIAFL